MRRAAPNILRSARNTVPLIREVLRRYRNIIIVYLIHFC